MKRRFKTLAHLEKAARRRGFNLGQLTSKPDPKVTTCKLPRGVK